jgi:electron transfer flavoprotein alpha subunit
MSILVIADHNHETILPATLNAVAAAGEIGGDISVLVAGSGCGAAAKAAAEIAGVSTVLVADSANIQTALLKMLRLLFPALQAVIVIFLRQQQLTGKISCRALQP